MSTGSKPGDGPGNSPPESPPPESPHVAGAIEAPASDKDGLPGLEKRVSELEAQLAKARESLAQSERRRDVYRLLVESGATDLEATSALVMEKIDNVAQPDIAGEVRTLKRRKPGFFKRSSSASSMGGRDSDEPPATPAEAAAKEARSGGRAALLRYMRARRA